MQRWILAGAAGLAAAGAASAQQSVVVNLTGVQLRNATNQFRSSAPNTISPAYRYHVVVAGMVKGVGGALGLLYPNPTPLATVMEALSPGSSAALDSYADNCSGTHPFGVPPTTQAGTAPVGIITVTYAFTLATGIDATNVASFSLTNVMLSPSALVGYLEFTSGGATLTRVNVCPANCDGSTVAPVLNVNDFTCFLNKFAAGDSSANCDCGTIAPILNVNDFTCFINRYAVGCPT